MPGLSCGAPGRMVFIRVRIRCGAGPGGVRRSKFRIQLTLGRLSHWCTWRSIGEHTSYHACGIPPLRFFAILTRLPRPLLLVMDQLDSKAPGTITDTATAISDDDVSAAAPAPSYSWLLYLKMHTQTEGVECLASLLFAVRYGATFYQRPEPPCEESRKRLCRNCGWFEGVPHGAAPGGAYGWRL